MTPSEVGDVSAVQVMAALVAAGEIVLTPFGDSRRYDLALDRDGSLVRVQVKTGRLRGGAIRFNTCSYTAVGGERKARHYSDGADVFGVYCPETRACYLVPVADLPPRQGSLRVEPPKNNQQEGVRLADTYAIA